MAPKRPFQTHGAPDCSCKRRQNPPWRWDCLPTDIRIEILEDIAQAPRLAPYAGVCLEWQEFFEKITFRRLTLEDEALEAFASVVRGEKVLRLNYIRHIWLRIKLAEYTCEDCHEPEDMTTADSNNMIFTDAIKDFLGILSTWDGDATGGLTLDLSAHSPSDVEHVFRDSTLEDNHPYHHEEDLVDYGFSGTISKTILDETHVPWSIRLWPRSRRPARPTHGETQRLYGTPLEFREWTGSVTVPESDLPRATIVKGLLTRYQFYRQISPEALGQILRESLVALEWARLERRYRPEYQQEISYLKGFQQQVLPSLPTTLKRFTYFSQSFIGVRIGQSASPELPIFAKNSLEGSDSGLTDLAICPLGGMLRFLKQFHAAEGTKDSPPWRDLVRQCLEHLDEEEPQTPPDSPDEPETGTDEPESVTDNVPDWKTLEQQYLEQFDATELEKLAPWQKLERLCIGPVNLIPTSPANFIDSVLTSAAVVVGSLPRLRVMELWSEDEMDSSVLRYTCDSGQPVLTWRSTWPHSPAKDLHFSPIVEQAWTTAVSRVTHCSLTIKIEPLPDRSDGNPLASFIHSHLWLKEQVLHPLTLKQLEDPVVSVIN